MLKSQLESESDSRLESEEFREAVRLVFEHLDIENKMSNFRLYDKSFDWYAIADNIKRPRHHAVVVILCRSMPTEFTTLITLRGDTREEALKTLDPAVYEFKYWA